MRNRSMLWGGFALYGTVQRRVGTTRPLTPGLFDFNSTNWYTHSVVQVSNYRTIRIYQLAGWKEVLS